MTVLAFLTNAGVILIVMGTAALLETAVPMFIGTAPTQGRRHTNLGLMGLVFLSNWLFASLAAFAAVPWRPAGLLAGLGWPLWVHVLAGIFVLDFSVGYLSHRSMHAWPAMWRFHQIHHSDEFVDVTTTFRQHPVETLWRFLFAIAPVWILGLPVQAVLIQRLLQASNGVIEHANIRVWPSLDRLLSLVFVTPNVHKMHHSREVSETNSNYANLLTIYDRIFGTYTPSDRAETVVYGLDEADRMAGAKVGALLTIPFEARPSATGVPDRKVRIEAGMGR